MNESNQMLKNRLWKENEKEGFRIYVNQGGTSSGKTYTILMMLSVIALRDARSVISVVGQDLPNLKVGAIRDFKTIVSNYPVLADAVKYNESDHIAKFSNGSIIEFKSYENEQDAKSGKRDYLFVNEANGIQYEVYWQLAIRTKHKIWIDYNPTSRFWVHEKVLGADDVHYIQSDHRWNRFLSDEQHRRIENIDDPQLWEVYARGNTGHITGLIFANWDVVDHLPPQDEWKMDAYGMDFGFTNDPTALEHVVLAHGELWIDEIIYESGMTNPDIARRVKGEGITSKDIIIADCAEPKSIAEIHRMGLWIVPSTKGNDSINQGIDILKRYKIHCTRRSKGLIDNFGKYKWKVDRNGEPMNTPIDDFNHGIDAIRYVALAKLAIRSVGGMRIRVGRN